MAGGDSRISALGGLAPYLNVRCCGSEECF